MKNYKNFLNIPQKYSDFKNSKAVIVPFPYEVSTTYGKGAKLGPKAIINASSQVELFDEELEQEIYKKVGICTLPEIKPQKSKNKFYIPLAKKVKEIIDLNKFPIILGGEHSITLGGTIVSQEKYQSFSILHFDAHSDLRDQYEGNKFSHGAVIRRVLENNQIEKLVQVGIRNISNESKEGSEFDYYKKNQDRIKIFWAKDMEKWQIDEIVRSLSDNVYLTFDVDVFDPSIMPSTGTPEPGGINWYQALAILKSIFRKKNVFACDVMELAPKKDFFAPDFMVAKLIYKMIGYKFVIPKSKNQRPKPQTKNP